MSRTRQRLLAFPCQAFQNIDPGFRPARLLPRRRRRCFQKRGQRIAVRGEGVFPSRIFSQQFHQRLCSVVGPLGGKQSPCRVSWFLCFQVFRKTGQRACRCFRRGTGPRRQAEQRLQFRRFTVRQGLKGIIVQSAHAVRRHNVRSPCLFHKERDKTDFKAIAGHQHGCFLRFQTVIVECGHGPGAKRRHPPFPIAQADHGMCRRDIQRRIKIQTARFPLTADGQPRRRDRHGFTVHANPMHTTYPQAKRREQWATGHCLRLSCRKILSCFFNDCFPIHNILK